MDLVVCCPRKANKFNHSLKSKSFVLLEFVTTCKSRFFCQSYKTTVFNFVTQLYTEDDNINAGNAYSRLIYDISQRNIYLENKNGQI